MNKVFLIGNLTRDPELGETSSGVSVCHFTIAVNRSYTTQNGERQTDFFNVSVWRGLAENVAKYTKKGSKVAVTGCVQLRNYEDNQGNKRTTVDIIADNVEFLSSPANGGSDGYEAPAPSRRPASSPKPVQGRLEEFDDDGDIPF